MAEESKGGGKSDGGGELVSWHETPAEANETRDALASDGELRYTVHTVTRQYLETLLSQRARAEA